MLTELRITNFALIDHLHLEFPAGFIVFTGETGAGKSLLIDALLLLVGGRATSDLIRFGADEAILEASFELQSTHPLVNQLKQDGYLLPDQEEIIIRRILSRSGKNRCYVNGQLAPLQIIQGIGQQLVDIHGQHEQQSLLLPKTQLKLLDAFGNLEEVVSGYQKQFREWVEKKAALEELLQRVGNHANRQDVLQYQYDELMKMELQSGEEEALNQEYHRLKHSGRLGELSGQAYTALYERDGSVLDQLDEVNQWVQSLAQLDSQGAPWVSLLETATIALREVIDNLRNYRSQMEYDPQRMEMIDTRLAALQRLRKKYGKTIEDLMEWTRELEKELFVLQHGEKQVAQQQTEVTRQFELVKELAKDLSAKRKQTAKQLAQEIKQELATLKMETMDVQVNVERGNVDHAVSVTGIDRIDILLAPNPGEPPLPLSRVASGGETSRIMLALKTIFAGNDRTPVVIFDEIDNGVGGEAGMVMGGRLRQLARFHQVCCITHLPQLASHAHAHFVVEKSQLGNRTLTQVHQVTGTARELEIARMLGGGTVAPTIRKTAGELLDRGSRSKGAAVPSQAKRKSNSA